MYTIYDRTIDNKYTCVFIIYDRTNNCTTAACSVSSSSTSESSHTASCKPSNSSASGADDDTIPTNTTASSTDSEALSLLEKVRAPSKNLCKKLQS